MADDNRLNRAPSSLADRIAAKRKEIEASGFCRWDYRKPGDVMDRNEFISTARQMYDDARHRYVELARPYLLDAALREFSAGLVAAIGEVSPEEAVAALRKMAIERGHVV